MMLTYETESTRLKTSTSTRMQFVGQRCEGAVMASLLKAGKRVLLPATDARYDLIVDQDGTFIRIQCKSGRITPNGWGVVFATYSQNLIKGRYVRQGYHGEADFFGVYSAELDKVYFVPVEGTGKQSTTLYLREPRNRRGNNTRLGPVRFASDYEFSPTLSTEDRDGVSIKRDPSMHYALHKDSKNGKWYLRWREPGSDAARVRRSLTVGAVVDFPTKRDVLIHLGWNPNEGLGQQPVRPRNLLPYPTDWQPLSQEQKLTFLKTRWSQAESVH